jgi:hypothetical protein
MTTRIAAYILLGFVGAYFLSRGMLWFMDGKYFEWREERKAQARRRKAALRN